jgi:D-amino-acid dehydrogenase
MNVFGDERNFDKARASLRLLAELGVRVEVLDAQAALAREPALKSVVAGALFNPGDAQLRPDRYVAELARIVRAAGRCDRGKAHASTASCAKAAASRASTPAKADSRAARWSSRSAPGRRRSRASSACAFRSSPARGIRSPIRAPARCPRIPMTLKEPSVCVTAWNSGYRLGSTMEFAGYDTRLNRTRLDALRRGAAQFLHEPEGPAVIEQWYGWRPMTPDDLPLLGRASGSANLTLATGHGMLGVSLSAVTGCIVGEVITGKPPSFDLAPFDPSRFG